MSDRTKIGVSTLRAIENNGIERLPGGIFTRGFLKAYAFEVGLDPADITQRYLSQFEPPPEQTEMAPREPPGDEYSDATAISVSEYSGAISAIAAVVLVAACFFVLSRLQTIRSPDQVAAVNPAAVNPVKPAPAAPASSPQEAATVSHTEVGTAGASNTVRVDLQPIGQCWVSAAADGTRMIYRTLEAGEHQTIDVRDALILRVGDPATCAYSINGTPGRPLGRPGQAVTVTITPDNYKTFFRP